MQNALIVHLLAKFERVTPRPCQVVIRHVDYRLVRMHERHVVLIVVFEWADVAFLLVRGKKEFPLYVRHIDRENPSVSFHNIPPVQPIRIVSEVLLRESCTPREILVMNTG